MFVCGIGVVVLEEWFDRHAAHLNTSSPLSSNDAVEHTPLRWTIPLQIEQE